MVTIRLTIALLFLVVLCQADKKVNAIDNEGISDSYRTRRSLCNTFGGCGAKRSLSDSQVKPQTLLRRTVEPASTSELPQTFFRDPKELSSMSHTTRNANADLVSEALGDLLDYMQLNENYRQGKYVVVVPSKYADLIPKSHQILLEDPLDSIQSSFPVARQF